MKPLLVTKLLFAPAQHPNSLDLLLVKTVKQMHRWLAKQGGETPRLAEVCEGQVVASLLWYPEAKWDHGVIIVAEETLSPFILSHECTHAAHHFISEIVMASPQVKAMTEDYQADYFDEALAMTQEALFQQAYEALYLPAERRVA